MIRPLLLASLCLGLAACDVEVSLGSHDGGADAHAPTPCSEHADAGTCVACQAERCCDALLLCEAAPNCSCLVDCVQGGATIDACRVHCGGDDHGEHAPLVACSRMLCSTECHP